MKPYSEEQKAIIGEQIATVFGVKFNKKTGRYITNWGEKTAIGIFNTFQSIAVKIESGEIL